MNRYHEFVRVDTKSKCADTRLTSSAHALQNEVRGAMFIQASLMNLEGERDGVSIT
jgi:hypothetical protein